MQIKKAVPVAKNIANSSIGQSGDYDGLNFSVKALSKVIKKGCLLPLLAISLYPNFTLENNLTDLSVTVVFSE